MLCKLQEGGRPKCDIYWPDKEGHSLKLKTGIITFTKESDYYSGIKLRQF